MNTCGLPFSITALANAIACHLADDELSLTASVFTQLGDTLSTIAIQRELFCKNSENTVLSVNVQTHTSEGCV